MSRPIDEPRDTFSPVLDVLYRVACCLWLVLAGCEAIEGDVLEWARCTATAVQILAVWKVLGWSLEWLEWWRREMIRRVREREARG